MSPQAYFGSLNTRFDNNIGKDYLIHRGYYRCLKPVGEITLFEPQFIFRKDPLFWFIPPTPGLPPGVVPGAEAEMGQGWKGVSDPRTSFTRLLEPAGEQRLLNGQERA